ncbi:MAG: DegT/DnrJ/EryC1/StrS aminotransferase family protein, partial [Deltaproteobacteria bacterium]|nr:DegT/DnrJ/EryC1/StrS aminotransferase family protein [Deltaproteobacteria bacterium]
YLSANPLLRGPHLWGPPCPGNASQVYAGAWAAASGRVALAAALKHLGLKPGQRVLLPAYLCPSVLAPLEHLGLEPDLYPLTPTLEPDWAGLKSRLAGAGAMVAIHYWGFPQPVVQMAGLAREAGVPLIEDCALALFSRRGERLLGSFGQAAVFSLTKSLPTPDGGLLWLAGQEAGGSPPAGANRLGLAGLLAYRGEDLINFSPRTFEGKGLPAPRGSRSLGPAHLRNKLGNHPAHPGSPFGRRPAGEVHGLGRGFGGAGKDPALLYRAA